MYRVQGGGRWVALLRCVLCKGGPMGDVPEVCTGCGGTDGWGCRSVWCVREARLMRLLRCVQGAGEPMGGIVVVVAG